jgi:hypothetical protein
MATYTSQGGYDEPNYKLLSCPVFGKELNNFRKVHKTITVRPDKQILTPA